MEFASLFGKKYEEKPRQADEKKKAAQPDMEQPGSRQDYPGPAAKEPEIREPEIKEPEIKKPGSMKPEVPEPETSKLEVPDASVTGDKEPAKKPPEEEKSPGQNESLSGQDAVQTASSDKKRRKRRRRKKNHKTPEEREAMRQAAGQLPGDVIDLNDESAGNEEEGRGEPGRDPAGPGPQAADASEDARLMPDSAAGGAVGISADGHVQEEAGADSAAPCAEEGGDMSGTNRETGETEESFDALLAEGMAQVAESVADAKAGNAPPASAGAPGVTPVDADGNASEPGGDPVDADCDAGAPREGPVDADSDAGVPGEGPVDADSDAGVPGESPVDADSVTDAPGEDPVEVGSDTDALGDYLDEADAEAPGETQVDADSNDVPGQQAAPGEGPVEAAGSREMKHLGNDKHESLESLLSIALGDELLEETKKACMAGNSDMDKMSQVWGNLLKMQGLIATMQEKYIASQKAVIRTQDEMISIRDTLDEINASYKKMQEQLWNYLAAIPGCS
ncbi:MAG: hypothetical protein LUE14_04340 [Clostridiales bacterium]|nr:hypothetical protein [Clostridiales bacterium]